MKVIHIVWKALYMAMKYVPKDKQSEIEAMICNGCRYDNDEEELACYWCQMGSMFERKINCKQYSDPGCNEFLKSNCDMKCDDCYCRDCKKRFVCKKENISAECVE